MAQKSGRTARVLAVSGAMVALAVGVAACTIGPVDTNAAAQQPSTSESSAADEAPIDPEFSVSDGAEDVDPSVPVEVTADEGQLDDVEMVNENGKVVDSKLSEDGSSWTSAEPLGYGRTYTVTATTADGEEHEVTFYTSVPDYTTGVAIAPLPDSTVGVGQAIDFVFPSAPADREAVEKRIKVTTSNDTEGAFYWISDREVKWRPKDFWEPGTEVTVDAPIYGLDMGGGLYGSEDNATNFTVGDDVRAIVDDNSKTMKVYRNGELLRTIPVSLGRDGGRWATPNGTYVVGDENESMIMNSETFGLAVEDGGYSTKVDYATQLSYSGIYVHSAPWSVYAQGSTNTSHGCVNVTPEAAAWFQDTVKRGDPVIIQNTTGGTLPGWDGLGHWNIDWETWEAGDA